MHKNNERIGDIMSFEQKIMQGFSDIHVAKRTTEGTYATPVLVEGGKSVDIELNFESNSVSADNRTIYFDGFAGGDGTLGVLSLTTEEMSLLFGHTKVGEDGLLVKSTDIAANVALGFSRNKLDGTKVGYWVYDCKFSTPGIAATTLEEGKADEEVMEITFKVAETQDRKVYYTGKVTDSFFESVPVNPTAPTRTVQAK